MGGGVPQKRKSSTENHRTQDKIKLEQHRPSFQSGYPEKSGPAWCKSYRKIIMEMEGYYIKLNKTKRLNHRIIR